MLLRIIALSAIILVGSFLVTPAYFGISAEHRKLDVTETASLTTQDEITFEQIYALADETSNDAASLNNITPAAGGHAIEDAFSMGFTNTADTAL